MPTSDPTLLVSTDWLAERLTARWAALVDQLVQLGEIEADKAPNPNSLYLAR